MQDGCRILGSGKSGKMAKKYQHHKFPPCLGFPSMGERTRRILHTFSDITKFFGTTEKIDNAAAYEKKAYYLNGNKWWAVQNGVENDYIAPFRCFISSPTDAAASRSFLLVLEGDDSNVTGIQQLEGETAKDIHSGKYPFYSIDGKLMGKDYNKLERGQIYIVNGKKFYKF